MHDLISLLKPRILVMQFVSFSLGFVLSSPFEGHLVVFLYGLLGTGFISGGAASLNHAVEWRWDAQMMRTQNRPVVQKRISPLFASIFGMTLILIGIGILMVAVNALTALLGALTALCYVSLYTPSKRIHWINTYIGTIPGAMLPLGGWAAATGQLQIGAFLLGFVLLVW